MTKMAVCAGHWDVTDKPTLETLQACEVVDGHVTIHELPQSVLSALATPGIIDLGRLTTVQGDLRITDISSTAPDGAGLSIDAPELRTVQGALNVSRLHQLNWINLPRLSDVDTIAFTDVDFAPTADFGDASVHSLSRVQTIAFSNTSIGAIGDGWLEDFQPVDPTAEMALTIVDNPNLRSVMVPGWRDGNVRVRIERNAARPDVYLPAVNHCRLTLSGVGAFSGGNIRQIGFEQANSTEKSSQSTVDAKTQRRQADGVEDSGGSSITGNSFEDFTLQELATIYEPLEISGNGQLQTIGFGKLQDVFGEVEISGERITSYVLSHCC